MKFVLRCLRNSSCRRASISECGRHGDKTLETPMCMLYTRGGNAPYLGSDMFKKIQSLPFMAMVSLTHWAEHADVLAEYQKGVAKFSSMEDFLFYCCTHDTATEVPQGYNEKSGVAVWSRGGKIKVDVPSFMKIQEALQPDWYQALSDGDTSETSSDKRVQKAVDRTLAFLDEILAEHRKMERLKNSEVFGVIEGGYNIEERLRSAKETAARPVSGFTIGGFHNIGLKSGDRTIEDVGEIVKKTISTLPEDKPRLMSSLWGPDSILEGIEQGLDIFDTSYPLKMSFNHDKFIEHNSGAGFHIDLNHKRYCEDFGPVLENCSCYTCQRFSRAYINHLLNTSELLAGVLLSLHNLHHYLEYFESIRCALSEDTFDELKTLIKKQKPETVDTSD
ncbi:hypothetical protein ScPMuIL_010022 [Solemya velum]